MEEKLLARDFACLKQIEEVLDTPDAEYELQRVLDGGLRDFARRREWDLVGLIDWGETPQGFVFWRSINNGVLPHEYR